MKYASLDQNNLPNAFYDSGIHGDNIPAAALPLTQDQWRECINNQGRRKVIDNGDGTSRLETYTPPLPDLADYKETAKLRVDNKAGEVRTRFPSPGALTPEEYLQAEKHAQDYKDAGYSGDVHRDISCWINPNDSNRDTAAKACDHILATAAVFREALTQVRDLRLPGKDAIEAAADHAAVDAAESNTLSALDAITPTSVANDLSS